MTRKCTHELNKEVQSISGWYKLYKEEKITYKGQEFLYFVGDAAVESSCCGVGGCHYAVVPGSVVRWKSETNAEGLFISLVEPVANKKLQNELREILIKKEGVNQVQFW